MRERALVLRGVTAVEVITFLRRLLLLAALSCPASFDSPVALVGWAAAPSPSPSPSPPRSPSPSPPFVVAAALLAVVAASFRPVVVTWSATGGVGGVAAAAAAPPPSPPRSPSPSPPRSPSLPFVVAAASLAVVAASFRPLSLAGFSAVCVSAPSAASSLRVARGGSLASLGRVGFRVPAPPATVSGAVAMAGAQQGQQLPLSNCKLLPRAAPKPHQNTNKYKNSCQV